MENGRIGLSSSFPKPVAKLSELSDTQLEKAYLKYSNLATNDPSGKNKKIAQQIQAERHKRKETTTKNEPEGDALAAMSKRTEIAHKQKQAKRQKKASKGLPKVKGAGPALSTTTGNALLFGGLAAGITGLLLFADHMLLQWIPAFPGKMVIYVILIIAGFVCSKLSSILMDDNR